jgi:hypothetical protein
MDYHKVKSTGQAWNNTNKIVYTGNKDHNPYKKPSENSIMDKMNIAASGKYIHPGEMVEIIGSGTVI